MRQARARVLGGDTRVEGKLVSVFEPTTEIIRKGKASKPTEFGKLVRIQYLFRADQGGDNARSRRLQHPSLPADNSGRSHRSRLRSKSDMISPSTMWIHETLVS
jgi:hypothetical protein